MESRPNEWTHPSCTRDLRGWQQDRTAILDVDKEVLKNAPGFDKDHWPNNAQYEAGWLVDIYEYYGYSPYWMPDE